MPNLRDLDLCFKLPDQVVLVLSLPLSQLHSVLDLVIINLNFFHLALLLLDAEGQSLDFVPACVPLDVLLHL